MSLSWLYIFTTHIFLSFIFIVSMSVLMCRTHFLVLPLNLVTTVSVLRCCSGSLLTLLTVTVICTWTLWKSQTDLILTNLSHVEWSLIRYASNLEQWLKSDLKRWCFCVHTLLKEKKKKSASHQGKSNHLCDFHTFLLGLFCWSFFCRLSSYRWMKDVFHKYVFSPSFDSFKYVQHETD